MIVKMDNNINLIKRSKNRIIYIDILNILAAMSVVALHCNGIVHGSPNVRAWTSSLIIECICYWAVPVFLMLTGATLMKYRDKYDTKNFFKKRVLKVLIPFIFWSIMMLIWRILTKQIILEDILGIRKLINVFLQNREESTYYFMWIILGIYLTMPLLSHLAKAEYRKTLWFSVLLYFIFNSLLPNISFLIGIEYNNSLSIQVGEYIIFVILGYLLSIEDLSQKHKNILYISAIIGVIFRYFMTFVASKNVGYVVKSTWGYTQWHSILLAAAVFVFVKSLNFDKKLENKEKVVEIISKVAGCSFGVYLIHLIVRYYELKIFNISEYSWHFRTVGILTTYLISLGIVYGLKKIPILRKIVP